jgi:hypothetical protein
MASFTEEERQLLNAETKFSAKCVDLNEQFTIFHNKEPHDLYWLQTFVRIVKSESFPWVSI